MYCRTVKLGASIKYAESNKFIKKIYLKRKSFVEINEEYVLVSNTSPRI